MEVGSGEMYVKLTKFDEEAREAFSTSKGFQMKLQVLYSLLSTL